MDSETFHADENTLKNRNSDNESKEVEHLKKVCDEKQVISESFKNLHVSIPLDSVSETKSKQADYVNVSLSKDSSSKIPSKEYHGKKKYSEAEECSNSSSCADSVSLRTRKAFRISNLPLINLSSDSESDSNTKQQTNLEVNKPFHRIRSNKGKRFAHIKGEYLRQLATVESDEEGKKNSDNSSETSNTSVIKKVKRKTRRNLVNKAALARRKFFGHKSVSRNKCLTANRLLRVRSVHQAQGKLNIKKRLRQFNSVTPKKQSSNTSRVLHTQCNSSSSLKVKQPGKRGRPRKFFKVENMPTAESSKNCSDNDEKVEIKKNSSGDDESFKKSSKNDSLDGSSSNGKEYFENKPTSHAKKRGRGKFSQNVMVDKSTAINKKIKPFLQKTSCIDYIQRISKCRECRLVSYNKSKKNQGSYCRFLEYRKLCCARNGTILNAGFSSATDCTEEDRHIWLPKPEQAPDDLSIETAKALLIQVGDQFCDLIIQEKEALSLHIGTDQIITWKKTVQGVREMCDVCDTTLFNIHWVCPKCGLAVCIDCYKVRKQGIVVESEESASRGRDEYLWLLCNSRQPHEQEQLLMTQIVPGNILWTMQAAMHKAREKWKIVAYCKCVPHNNSTESSKNIPTGICKQLMSCVSKSFSVHPMMQQTTCNNLETDNQFQNHDAEINDNALKWLDSKIQDSVEEDQSSDSDDMMYGSCYESFASLKNMLLQGNHETTTQLCPSTYLSYSVDDIIDCVIETKSEKTKTKCDKESFKLFNYRYPQRNSGRDPWPIRIFTTTESSIIYSDVPHSWLCNGRLLLLHQAQHNKNLELFQEQWKRGQPIMVMGVDKSLNMTLWHPDSFCEEFGEIKNDLVNCKTGAVIPNLPMKKFWEGFENFDKRLKDDYGEYMLLKLKDWPPGEDFSEKLPKRFNDLMQGLPLPEYTHRDGIFNLAGRLPTWFVRPDLGPKMYNAYGSALFPAKGTTNLHLDISDAVNVMVYVGMPPTGNEEHVKEALKAIDEGGCDSLMRERVRSKGVRPGALWHIYNARDADKIRDMLTKVAIERGEKLEAHHDPIHDQSWYIDAELRKKLYHEYGVEGYAIAQCLGDAVFIPAGAPHQVRNLHSCVKVAEDFVSPENIGHCFKLTQEFRHLSDTHTNHEDKLQIKNIIYHVVKDSLSHLLDSDMVKEYHLGIQDL